MINFTNQQKFKLKIANQTNCCFVLFCFVLFFEPNLILAEFAECISTKIVCTGLDQNNLMIAMRSQKTLLAHYSLILNAIMGNRVGGVQGTKDSCPIVRL